ncbi:MAG TPA: NADPH-dependent FMN reductase [Verrucomicrobiae bacterium]|nr:NADPH-dependent FMN reductase [Verrucomicrobiae bacterium]
MAAKVTSKVRVAGICGSLRRESYTRMALKVALGGAEEAGAEVQLIDLRDYQLVFCDGGDHGDNLPKDVTRLRDEVKHAQGILLGTPEYHGGYSGVLKNALDLMGFDEFEGKMIGLVGVSGGNLGAFGALSALRSVGRALHAWVVPEQAAVANADEVFDDEGKCKDEAIERRLKAVGRQVAKFASLHNSEQAREFLQFWEAAAENPGGGDR